ncbi:hypothetical protein ATANTOWER_018712 [Ataeniobius toweri]|uniref:Uncharacterized protein n=1 Tax=Ataeniobius toweri TaxID=208326 RepID=A0ABU7BTB7_9TELE|nr:hypothetical protein [Ataeniobius toweri]
MQSCEYIKRTLQGSLLPPEVSSEIPAPCYNETAGSCIFYLIQEEEHEDVLVIQTVGSILFTVIVGLSPWKLEEQGFCLHNIPASKMFGFLYVQLHLNCFYRPPPAFQCKFPDQNKLRQKPFRTSDSTVVFLGS